MSGRMEIDKPVISILMAVYEPNLDWFREQLRSLNRQTYPNLRLYVRDDSSSAIPFEDIQNCVQSCITNFSYSIERNSKNEGSNKVFERLTTEARGEYFAYCDQDDIWLPEKLEVLQKELEASGAMLICSDMYLIDENGMQYADSITKVRRHHQFKSGDKLSQNLLFHNFVTGCTMLVRAAEAKEAIPFCPYMVHDHYLALWCAEKGSILSLESPLIQYRVHRKNQTGILSGVRDKESYRRVRIDALQARLQWLLKEFPCSDALQNTLWNGQLWAKARADNWHHVGGKRLIWKYRHFSVLPSVFELFAAELPEPVFRLFLTLAKRNMI